MATLTIRNLPDDVRDALRVRAARNGRSMEAEVRQMLAEGLRPPPAQDDRRMFEAALDEAQADFAAFTSRGVLASEELIAERRLEAWRETLDRGGEVAGSRRDA